MGKQKADYLLRSDHIFTSTVENPFAGYVAVSGQNILAVGTDDGSDWIDEQTEVLELEDQLVTPGFIDVHTFFTGYAIFHIGIDILCKGIGSFYGAAHLSFFNYLQNSVMQHPLQMAV